MKNRQAPRSRRAGTAPPDIDHLQLDLWGGSPAPAALETDAEPITPAAAGAPVAASSNAIEESSESSEAVRKTSRAVQAGGGRWPTRHGTRPPVAAGETVVPFRAPTASATGDGAAALTRRQHELLDYLRRRRLQGLLPPSLTEICRDLGLASRGSLHKQVVALVKAGLVEPMMGKQRGVRLVVDAANDEGRVPLLGAIAAGRPIEAVLRQESIEVPAWMTRGLRCYALRVKGDSMRDAGILDGDLVLVEPRTEARNGEAVVALIDREEATLKRIEQRPGEILLIPENSAHAVQRYAPDRVEIQGIVIGVLRRY
jgi:repressor LexA